MFVHCACGQRHWGARGAAGLLLVDLERTSLLLQHRARSVHHGGTWACIGGAIEHGETPADAAVREAVEEEDLDPGGVRTLVELPGLVHPDWTYTYVLAEADRSRAGLLGESWSWESDGTRWVDLDRVADLRLHPGLHRDWPWLRAVVTTTA